MTLRDNFDSLVTSNINPGTWNKQEKKWREKFDGLRRYKDQNGNCLVSVQDKNHRSLASWVSNQRTQYRSRIEGKKASINLNRIHLLNSIGFVWKVNPDRKSKFDHIDGDSKDNSIDHTNKNEPESIESKPESNPIQTRELETCSSITNIMNESKCYSTSNCEVPESTQGVNKDQLNSSIQDPFQLTTDSTTNSIRQQLSTNTRGTTWDDMFVSLKLYKEKNGDTLVPKEYNKNPALGTWCYNQRQHLKFLQNGGATEPIEKERVNRLNKIGFTWVDVNKELWNEMFCLWREQKEEQNDIPQPKLRLWVSNQRRYYKRYKKGLPTPLTISMISKLEANDFEWDQSLTVNASKTQEHTLEILSENFETMVERLKQFREANNHCLILPTSNTDASLKQFASLLRRQYKALSQNKPSIIDDEKMTKLNALGFVWDIGGNTAKHSKWRDKFEKLDDFHKKHGHCNFTDEPDLERFTNEQRSMYQKLQSGKQSGLTSEQIVMLESIGFCWEQHSREVPAEKINRKPQSAVKEDDVKKFLVNCKSKMTDRDFTTPIESIYDGITQPNKKQKNIAQV